VIIGYVYRTINGQLRTLPCEQRTKRTWAHEKLIKRALNVKGTGNPVYTGWVTDRTDTNWLHNSAENHCSFHQQFSSRMHTNSINAHKLNWITLFSTLETIRHKFIYFNLIWRPIMNHSSPHGHLLLHWQCWRESDKLGHCMSGSGETPLDVR
jgi:hypothetical protein